MDLYHVMLYVHLLALVAGAIASSLSHFSMARLERARTGGDALQWLSVLKNVSKVFPAALLTFFITGGYMVAKSWSWQVSFVEVGAAGAILLMINGIIIGTRAGRLPPMLVPARDAAVPPQAKAVIHGPVMSTLPWVNTTLVFGIMFVMTTKPALGASLLSVGIAIALGLLLANRFSAPQSVSTPEATLERA